MTDEINNPPEVRAVETAKPKARDFSVRWGLKEAVGKVSNLGDSNRTKDCGHRASVVTAPVPAAS